MTEDRCRSLLVTGGLGTGKSTVIVEIGFVLEEAGLTNAVIDTDWLAWVGPDVPDLPDLLHDNLKAVTDRMTRSGIRWFVLARSIFGPEELAWLTDAVPDHDLTVVALDVDQATAERRIRDRAVGSTTEHDLAQVEERAHGADFVARRVVNGSRPVRDTALDVLRAAGWPDGSPSS
jgi:hypothetical protein